ncbi:hypothetical protein MFLO_15613, partial [Listeria floridensis FSL S10-1187]
SARMLFTQEMYQHVSKTFKVITIDSFRNDTQYKLEGLDFWWHEDWLESAYEKIEVGQQMADWLDTMPDAWKRDADLALYKVVAASSAYQRDELRSKKLVPIWLIESVLEYESTTLTTIADAIRYGYKVKKEQLYYVRLPEVEEESAYLNKTVGSDEIGFLDKTEDAFFQTKFIESEIKKIDERYWNLAIKVEEDTDDGKLCSN